jgi:hypothetical protein
MSTEKFVGYIGIDKDGNNYKVSEFIIVGRSKSKMEAWPKLIDKPLKDHKEINFDDIVQGLARSEAYLIDEESYQRFIDYGYEDDPSFEDSYMIIPEEDEEILYGVKSFSF